MSIEFCNNIFICLCCIGDKCLDADICLFKVIASFNHTILISESGRVSFIFLTNCKRSKVLNVQGFFALCDLLTVCEVFCHMLFRVTSSNYFSQVFLLQSFQWGSKSSKKLVWNILCSIIRWLRIFHRPIIVKSLDNSLTFFVLLKHISKNFFWRSSTHL